MRTWRMSPPICSTRAVPDLSRPGEKIYVSRGHAAPRSSHSSLISPRRFPTRTTTTTRPNSHVCSAEATQVPTRLNTIPHPRETRYWFYNEVVSAVNAAVFDNPAEASAAADPNLISVFCSIPELNPAYDVYRVGSLLECVREVSTSLSKRGKKVKVAVQQSLGEGVFCGMPLALSGVKRLLLQMDWGEDTPVSIAEGLGREEIDECDSYILIAPQNLQGSSVLPYIQDMVEQATEEGKNGKRKDIILINARLGDVMSSGGVMGVRGRQERLNFVDRFVPAYHFRLLYIGIAMYPIMGCLRYSCAEDRAYWQVYRRRDFKDENNMPAESYDLLETFECQPDASAITAAFQKKR